MIGYGDSYGSGSGYGYGYGYGDSYGSGYGYSYGSGYGSGSGSGYGYRYGDRYADEIRMLSTGDPRGYRCIAARHGDTWSITAGCHEGWTLRKALDHWGSPDYPDPDIGRGYVLALLELT
jgi:hypothetical protein